MGLTVICVNCGSRTRVCSSVVTYWKPKGTQGIKCHHCTNVVAPALRCVLFRDKPSKGGD